MEPQETQVVPQNPVQETKPIVPKEPQVKSSLLVTMSILLIITVALAGLFYFQIQKLSKQLSAYQTQTSPAPTADPTANWETYLSPSKDYSFKHPSGLKSDTGAAGTGFESIRFIFMGQAQVASGRTQTELADGYAFTVTKIGPTSQFDPKKEIGKQAESSKENCKSVSAVSSVTIAKTSAFQYSGDCLGTYTLTYLSDGKNTYSIVQSYTSESYKTVTSQILSTFKFMGEDQPNVSDWETYTDTDYRFSIKYPDNFVLKHEITSPDSVSPSSVTGLQPSYTTLHQTGTKEILISINPEGYYGIQFNGPADETKTETIAGKQISIQINNENLRYYRLYQGFGSPNMPNFSIVTETTTADSNLINQIVSTLKFLK